MATGITPKYSLPFPVSTDPVRVAGDIEDLATRLDEILQEQIEDTSAAVWTGGTFSNGINPPSYNDTAGKMTMSLSQDIRSTASPEFAGLSITNNVSLSGDISAGGNVEIASTKQYLINGQSVLSENTLGDSVVGSSLTSVGNIISGTWSATAISPSKGGTGLTSFNVGDIIYASLSSELAALSAAEQGNSLISNGTSSAPSWGKIGLITHVSGVLPVSNGGTGSTESTGMGSVVLSNSPVITGTTTVDSIFSTGSSFTLLSSVTESPTSNASLIVNRGEDPDVSIRWNETEDAWQYTNDGTTYFGIATQQDIPEEQPDSLINVFVFGLG